MYYFGINYSSLSIAPLLMVPYLAHLVHFHFIHDYMRRNATTRHSKMTKCMLTTGVSQTCGLGSVFLSFTCIVLPLTVSPLNRTLAVVMITSLLSIFFTKNFFIPSILSWFGLLHKKPPTSHHITPVSATDDFSGVPFLDKREKKWADEEEYSITVSVSEEQSEDEHSSDNPGQEKA